MSDAGPFASDSGFSCSFKLANVRVDPTTGQISGPGGVEQVDPKVMAVLLALARTPRELVGRSQLLEEIWPGGVVYEDALTQCVYQLRQHLAAAGGAEAYRRLIKTLPKRGYLLDSEVAAEESTTGSPVHASLRASRRPPWGPLFLLLVFAVVIVWWLIRAGGNSPPGPLETTPPSPPNAIAVLPFENAGGDHGDDYLSEGISDDLRDQIAALRELRVAARRSSVAFRDSRAAPGEIAQELGVARLVEGRLKRKGDRISVSVELVDARSGFRLWSRTYDRASQDLVLIERTLARDLIQHLSPWRTELSEPFAVSFQQSAAHDLILLGRQYEQRLGEQQLVDDPILAKAIELYEQAVEIDPVSAEAHARLGSMLLYRGDIAQAEPHILEALNLDPGRGETFTTLGLYFWAVRADGIGAAYRRAIELNPSDADALSYFASWTWLQGNADEAVVYYRAALAVDPLSLKRYADLGYKLAFQGSRAEALEVLDRLQERFPTAPGYLAAARIHEALGDFDEAIACALSALELRPGDEDVTGQVAELLARVGAVDEAALFEPEPGMGQLFWERRYQDLADLAEALSLDKPGDQNLSYLLAFAYGALGRHDRAVAKLEAAGLPAAAISESRRADDLHALHTYMGSLAKLGREDEARWLASWIIDLNRKLLPTEGRGGWLPHLSQSCALVLLGRQEEALVELERLPELPTVPWLPWLQDLACFDPVKNEPRYTAVLAATQSRVTAVRARLPQTLARHGFRQWER